MTLMGARCWSPTMRVTKFIGYTDRRYLEVPNDCSPPLFPVPAALIDATRLKADRQESAQKAARRQSPQ
ncbi:hypothetical protein U1839_13550 [Sphingomonas sp. RT2P30]|uniref:hypothetical protein n=1 Tax=Parasphingomonas halimpatiens TaxID=3096162 RepID=UPI002FC89288